MQLQAGDVGERINVRLADFRDGRFRFILIERGKHRAQNVGRDRDPIVEIKELRWVDGLLDGSGEMLKHFLLLRVIELLNALGYLALCLLRSLAELLPYR